MNLEDDERESHPPNEDTVAYDGAKRWTMVQEHPADFGSWTSLIEFIEKVHAADMGKICQVYDSFLREFPLCYGYWRKYADHMLTLNAIDKAVEVYEEATRSLAYSVDHWVNYCSFAMVWFDDPADVQRLFERALSFVGKDYLNHVLWDKYIEFEFSQKQWGHLAHMYIRSLKFPNKQLDTFFESFKQLSANWRGELETEKDGLEVNDLKDAVNDAASEANCNQDVILTAINDLLCWKPGMAKTVALKKYLSAGEQLFHKSKCLDALIQQFEACIQRPYFHVKALDESQLKNWHLYLDFVETQRDFDWIVKLYERCLIPCASYPEFWIRYVQSMEDKGGREIANAALLRATQIFLKRMPAIHLFAARFKEQVRDISGAHSEFLNYNLDSFADYVENVIRKANMEKRLGNVEAACVVYERALEFAREGPRLQALPVLSIHYSQFKLMVTGSIEEARDILIKGIQQLPLCKLLYEALINFETVHGGPKQVALLESIIQKAVAPEADAADALSSSDREQISNLFLELVDCCGDVHQVKRAWDMHVRLFPHLFRPNYFQGNATAGYKYPFLTNLGGPLCTECGKKLHHPQHFAPESASSQQKLSNMPEVCQSEDKIVEPNVEHVTEALSFLDMTVRVPEHEAASNWEWQDQQVSHPREKIFEQSKVETLSGKPIYEAESESVQPQFELQYPKLEIALQPPPLETLSINPLQHEDHPSCSTSTHESKVPFLISHSNGSLTRGVNDNKLTIRYDEVQTQADLLQSKQDKTEYDISKTTKSPSLQLTGTPIAEATETKTHEVLPVNCVPHNQDHAVGNWQQMQYTGQPCATPGFGYQVYAQQHQQWQVAASMASYPPVDARCQVHPHHGYPYPLEYQYQVPPSAYHGSIQTWPVQNLQQTVVLAPQPQQNTDTVPFYYHQGQPSHYATPGAGYYGAAQTQQGFSWHLQQQHQQQLQQQQEWNSSHYQQRAAHVQYNANVPYGQEYDEQAVTPQVEGAVCPTSGPAALVHSQVQTSSSQ